MAQCSQCSAELIETDAFCQKCGNQVIQGVERKQVRQKLGNLAGEQHKKHIKSARTAIMAVAVLTILACAFLWFAVKSQEDKMEAEIKQVMSNPAMVLNHDIVDNARQNINQAKLMVGASTVMGGIFFFLFFWAKQNPFAASLTALILYVTSMVIAVAMNPETLVQGILIKIIIIAVLVNGVKSGLAYKKLQEGA
jgi:uncharacterized membrane protein YvbJ